MDSPPQFSVVVPVYNRPQEVQELLESLVQQTHSDFELIIVEDGSTEPCREIANRFADQLEIRYFAKENSGPGDSRNFGMAKAYGQYVVLFDSDCIIPANYFEQVAEHLKHTPLDAYGGPDDEHPSFSNIQKAINYAMTSFITTGGIRGREKQLDKFQPRSFNMGIRKSVIDEIGGFSDIHPGEDPDLSYRIMAAGKRVGLIPNAKVFHKRRIDFRKFGNQVYKFGVVRIILGKWHPGTLKLVYFLPSLFLLGSILLLILAMVFSPLFLIPLGLIAMLVFIESLRKSRHFVIALTAVAAAFIQLYFYGFGFLKSFFKITLMGGEEREVLPTFFFRSN